jgi:hypothetical protein
MNTVTIPQADVLRILNMLYSVFLGILARFAIQQTTGNNQRLEVHFLISHGNLIPVALLSIYFVFDWLSTNITVPSKMRINNLILPGMIVGIVCLGGLVAFAFVPSNCWLLLFGLYASIVPWYDLIDTKSIDEQRHGLINCLVIYGIILVRVTLGLFVFISGAFHTLLLPSNLLSSNDWWLLASVVLLKLFRYYVFVPLYHQSRNPKTL